MSVAWLPNALLPAKVRNPGAIKGMELNKILIPPYIPPMNPKNKRDIERRKTVRMVTNTSLIMTLTLNYLGGGSSGQPRMITIPSIYLNFGTPRLIEKQCILT